MQAIRTLLKPVASLRLTVALFVAAMALVFAGTLAQMHRDIHSVLNDYFHTFFIRIHGSWTPIPGGYTIGGLLLVNLIAAHTVRFKITRKRAGIIMVHLGLIVLLLSELVTSLFAVESQMAIREGSWVNYSEDFRELELAFTTPDDEPGLDLVNVIPHTLLRRGKPIRVPDSPLEVSLVRWLPNARILGPMQMGNRPKPATQGFGKQIGVDLIPPVTEAGKINSPAAVVELRHTQTGEELGSWLVTMELLPQEITVGNRTWHVALRPRRDYKPYAIQLIDFKHDRYQGIDTPRSFSSKVRIIDDRDGTNREAVIWMNHPLRYEGETFYQASYDAATEQTSILQVVRNPNTLTTYIPDAMLALIPGVLVPFVTTVPGMALCLVTVGLCIHFGVMLGTFVSKEGV
ncbi:MAG: ResB protein required for cytochrome C biosynthesis [Phycisphaera sp.]|nr:ResB protein required for cytochrome C biosynthesis [Phycisphaera sp.]